MTDQETIIRVYGESDTHWLRHLIMALLGVAALVSGRWR